MTRARARLTLALALTIVVSVGCGGDDERLDAAPGTPANPLVALPPDAAENAAAREPSGAAAEPGYQRLVAEQTGSPQERLSPCNLVTERDARTIVGAPIEPPFEAPQGPTCIYRTQDGENLITLAVQKIDFADIKRAIRGRRTLAVSGRDAYCGDHGQPMLYVPLRGRRVLSVAAPCDMARDFAHEALRHL